MPHQTKTPKRRSPRFKTTKARQRFALWFMIGLWMYLGWLLLGWVTAMEKGVTLG